MNRNAHKKNISYSDLKKKSCEWADISSVNVPTNCSSSKPQKPLVGSKCSRSEFENGRTECGSGDAINPDITGAKPGFPFFQAICSAYIPDPPESYVQMMSDDTSPVKGQCCEDV